MGLQAVNSGPDLFPVRITTKDKIPLRSLSSVGGLTPLKKNIKRRHKTVESFGV